MSRWLGLREEQQLANTLLARIASLFPEAPARVERLRNRRSVAQTRGWLASIDGR